MLNRSAFFAIAASVALSLVALSTAGASARPGHGGGMRSHAHFTHAVRHFAHHPRAFVHHRVFLRRNFVRPYWKWTKWRPYWRPYWRWAGRPFCWRHPYAYYCHPRVRAFRVGAAAVVGAAGAAAVVSRTSAPVSAPQPAASENCLTQTRLADGNSLFRNVCTNEAAITSNLPADTASQEQPPAK